MVERGGKTSVFAMFGVLALGLAAMPARAVNDVSLNVPVASQTAMPGAVIGVTLDVVNLSTAVNGVQVLIHYDPTLLSLLDVLPTDLGLVPPAQGWVEVARNDINGDVDYAAVINGGSTFQPGTVATFLFSVIGEGTTTVSFRVDVNPFFTKLTRASDNGTILPTKTDTGILTLTCDDGLFCNGAEIFNGVACQPGVNPCDDGVLCTDDTCDETADLCSSTPNDANCPDDGLFCTGLEVCDRILDCISTGDPCLSTQFCNEVTNVCDACVVDTDCNDGVVCTNDTCVAGTCVFTADNLNCDDGLFCNGVETCDAVLDCQAGVSPCDDGVVCTDDVCDELLDTCTNTANNLNCDDGVFCNGAETCDPLLDCQAGVPPTCSDGVVCTDDVCDSFTDACVNTANNANCDDGLFCNGAETCDAVLDCQPGVNPCDDGVVCTDDVCDELIDTCTSTANNLNCDDGVFCNGAETCDPLLDCQAGVPPTCSDGVVCTDDVCDSVTDVCVNTANDLNCDDGLFCTGVETCDPVLDCQAGVPPTCSDGVVCTDDVCDSVTDACVNTANNLNCDDGLFCTGVETCDPVLDCQAGVDPCAPLICDEATALCLSPIHVNSIEVFYAGRFADAADPSHTFLATGSTATAANITNYMRGITGIRITFDNAVQFATTPMDALTFDWTTGTGITFSPVTGAATSITATASLVSGVTVVDIVLANDFVRRRWLKVTLDAAQVTSGGVALDGELTGNPLVLPSGNGAPGGNAVFHLGNITGDVDGDRKTSLGDIGQIRAKVNPFLSVAIDDLFDVDKDGKVRLGDVGDARLDVNPFFTLPLIAP